MMWGYGPYWTNGWFGPLMMAIMLLFWLALIGLVVWALVRWQRRSGPTISGSGGSNPAHAQPDAMEILRQRYARGEIDAATFEQMRERLTDSPVPGKEPEHVA